MSRVELELEGRTPADVRLEVAAVKAGDPGSHAIELTLAKNRLLNARSAVALQALELMRKVDRAAAAYSEAWVLETLGLTEAELLELVRAQTPNLAELGDHFTPPAATEPRA